MKTEAFENGFESRAFWKGIVLKTLPFQCGQVKTEALKTVPKKASYTVVSISVLGRFSRNDRQKHIKKYAFSNENGLVYIGENKTKTLVWTKIFCFVLVHTKADTFKNALVWSGHHVFPPDHINVTIDYMYEVLRFFSSFNFRTSVCVESVYKNMFYTNIVAEICEILRIFFKNKPETEILKSTGC